jgi:proteasome beta subunit
LEKEEQMKKYLKGTTTLGFVCKDGVVMASDSRSTMGHMIADKEAQKIYQIDDKLAMTTAGMVADNQMLVRIMKAQIALGKMQNEEMTVKAASTLLSNILHESRYFPYWVQLLVGGYDTEGRLYELDPVGGLSDKKVASTGSGSPTAYGVLETQYKLDMAVEDGKRLAVRAVKAALERDSATGNKVKVITITAKGLNQLSQEEIDKILKETE